MIVLALGACKGGTSDVIPPQPELAREIQPVGALLDCFNPVLFQTGTTWTASWFVRRYEPTFGFYDVTFGITETRTVLGAASFNGEDDAIQVRVSSVGDGGVGAGSTDEPENFTGEFLAYYALGPAGGEVRYLGAERESGEPGVFEPWEVADPHERLEFDLEPGQSVEQEFALATNGIERDKETSWTYDGQGFISVPAGQIDVCQVSGVGHEPSLFVPTVAGESFEILFALDTGIPVYIEYMDDTNFPMDPAMSMRLREAFLNGGRVH